MAQTEKHRWLPDECTLQGGRGREGTPGEGGADDTQGFAMNKTLRPLGTCVPNAHKDIVLTSMADAHTMARRQLYG